MKISSACRRPATAVAALAVVTAVALPATAATNSTSKPAAGVATSSTSILTLNLVNTTVAAGQVVAVAGNSTSPHAAKLVVTPLSSTATGPVGQQRVTTKNSPLTVPSTPVHVTLPAGLGSVVGPTLRAVASDSASEVSASALLKSLGSVSIATVPLTLKNASLQDVAKVTSGGATAQKTVRLGTAALPSLLALLKSLGLNVNALLQTLTTAKLADLGRLVGSGVDTLAKAVVTARDAVTTAGGAAADSLSAAQTSLAAALKPLHAYDTALSNAFTSVSTADATTLAGLGITPTTKPAAFPSLSGAALTTAQSILGASTLSALVTKAAAAVAAQPLLDAARSLVSALLALVNKVLGNLKASTESLLSLGGIRVSTAAVAASKPAASGSVRVGAVNVLGDKGLPLASLTKTLGGVTSTLTSVLTSVTGVTFTPPTVDVGSVQKSTHRSGRTRYATASITGLRVTLPSLKLPAALSATGLPVSAVSGSLVLGQLTDTAQWTPASSGTPTTTPGHPTSGGPLADTGAPFAVSVVALVAVGAALVLRRRRWTA